MAPTTRRNVTEKLQNLKATRTKDSEEMILEKDESDSGSDSLNSSESEISEVDSDIEELANESALQILSKLTTQSQSSSRGKHSQRVTRTQAKKSVETLVEDDEQSQSDDDEIQFVIDTKPFSSGQQTAAKFDVSSESDDEENESESDEGGHDEESHSENDSDESEIEEEHLQEEKHQHKQSSKSSASKVSSSLRVHIAEEIAKITHRKEDRLELASEMDPGIDFGGSYVSYDVGVNTKSQQRDSLEKMLQKSQQDKLIQKSVITPDFEKKHALPKLSLNQQKKQRKMLRDSKTGRGWYDMPAQEMTEDLRNNLRILKMRSTLDPKRFYKHNDMKSLPKFVQVGTVVDSPVDYYHSRIPNKQRKQNVVDELLADAEMRRYNKRKYLELQERSRRKVEGRFAGKKLKKFKKV